MKIQHIEFDDIVDFFSYMTAVSPPMKNMMPIMLHKDYLMAVIPLGTTDDTFLAIYTKSSIEPGIYEFDINSKVYKKVTSVERADKIYFIVLSPKLDTIAQAVLDNM